ncbi:tetraacyldisaccharide 4'-kinase [Alkanindiges sp. WGS2144]|uniref:tetraacyldisaccharide 4'-kinase n=1 Tax=Alkanindiges sp. WGS2144 TaxID=3366808 RepID=UPI00375099E7
MSLDQLFTEAWARQAGWLKVLKPLSVLYGLVGRLRQYLYQQNIFKSYRAPVPVMIIGNITVGGSGKTPLIIELVHFLRYFGLEMAVISRGYGGKGPFPHIVEATDTPDIVGDEPVLIVQQTGALMAVGPNRQQAIELLLKHSQMAGKHLDLILSDDGLQHLALQRDLEWIVLDVDRGLGNQQLLPAGFLREPVSRLNTATVIENGRSATSHLSMQLKAEDLQPLSLSSKVPPVTGKVHAVAGIGVPQRFFQSLRQLGFEVIEHAFPDHHDYQPTDLDFGDNLPIICTAKDAVKIHAFADLLDEKNIWVLPVQAQLSKACYELLLQQLKSLGITLPELEHSTR